MIVSLLIVAVSLSLFVYWFRCTVILILQTTPSTVEGTRKVAAANGLSWLQVRQQLCAPATADALPLLGEQLRGDYRVLKYLLGHVGESGNRCTMEQQLLMVHFRITCMVFAFTYRVRSHSARAALAEMSAIVEFFAGAVSQRLALADQSAVRS
jgi:hypothetical protein